MWRRHIGTQNQEYRPAQVIPEIDVWDVRKSQRSFCLSKFRRGRSAFVALPYDNPADPRNQRSQLFSLAISSHCIKLSAGKPAIANPVDDLDLIAT
jgi:hypothetical protein